MKYITKDIEEDVVRGVVEDAAVKENNLDVVVENTHQVSIFRYDNIDTRMSIVLSLVVNMKPLRKDTITTKPLEI